MRAFSSLPWLALSLVACGGRHFVESDPTTDASMIVDVARPDVSDVSDASDVAPVDASEPARVKVGQVVVREGAAAFGRTIVQSAFFDYVPQDEGCSEHDDGPCHTRACRRPGITTSDAGVSPPTRPYSAGVLTIAGSAMGPLTFTPDSSGNYQDYNNDGSYWQGGDALTLTAAGAAVPAFSATVSFPSPTMATDVMSDPFHPVQIDRSAGFTAHWTSPSGQVAIVITQSVDYSLVANQGHDLVDATARCVFNGADGVGMVPAAALVGFVASLGLSRADSFVSVYGLGEQTVHAGDFAVTFSVENGGITAAAELH